MALAATGILLLTVSVGPRLEAQTSGEPGVTTPTAGLPAALAGGTILFKARLRYESGDATNLKDANALTLGTLFGFQTATVDGFQGLIQGGNTVVLNNPDDYNASGTNPGGAGRVAFPDGPVTYLNQAWLSYSGFDSLLRVGRQQLNLDNVRFIGDVSWWQKMQTYDMAAVTAQPVADISLFYGYVWHVSRVFGNESPQPDWQSRSHIINVANKAWVYGTFAAYAYLLDFRNAPANSSDTYGASFTGTAPVTGRLKLTYRAEAATQSDAGLNPIAYRATYYHGAFGGVIDGYKLSVDYELLGSDGGRKGFATPLATLHAFNGWVDQFLATPARGLRDFAVIGGVPLTGATSLQVIYHKFNSDVGNQNFGHEWDALLTHKIGKHWTLLAEAGRYSRGSAIGYFDTNKYWFQTEFAF